MPVSTIHTPRKFPPVYSGGMVSPSNHDTPDDEGVRLGRPPIGPVIDVALWQDLLDRIDAQARTLGVPRAAIIRDTLLAAFPAV